MKNILLFNPRSAKFKRSIPNSILSVASVIPPQYGWSIVDGNLETDPWLKIERLISQDHVALFACTVMPGPQLKQAIEISKKIRQQFPDIPIVWGGYFPSSQPQAVLDSEFVDHIFSGPVEEIFPLYLEALFSGEFPENIPGLIFKREGKVVKIAAPPLPDPDQAPRLPYEELERFYPINQYLGRTFLGNKTIAYHSSYGCPFTCSFCAVVPIYNARWKSRSAKKVAGDILYLQKKYGVDAVEFHDNNFFVSEKRVAEFAAAITDAGINWWGEARIDTMHAYTDETLTAIRKAGCRMIFFGAESGNDAVLQQMNKGGTQNAQKIVDFAGRLADFDIIPEYSFVLGTPPLAGQNAESALDADLDFIRRIKKINPRTEIILYIYTPVPFAGAELYEETKQSGFTYPEKLEDWLNPEWQEFDLRRNPLTPWLTPKLLEQIREFEIVLNAAYPTVSDIKLSVLQRRLIQLLGGWRYRHRMYRKPLELRLLMSRWLHYRRPETEGF